LRCQPEVAFGHHRILALREIGATCVPLELRDLSDIEMHTLLTTENGSRNPDSLSAANASVNWLHNKLVDSVLEAGSWEKYCTAAGRTTPQPCKIIKTKEAFDNILRNIVQSDNAVGRRLILKYYRDEIGGCIPEATVEECLNSRKTANIEYVKQAIIRHNYVDRANAAAAERKKIADAAGEDGNASDCNDIVR
jgi:hypothetical protein